MVDLETGGDVGADDARIDDVVHSLGQVGDDESLWWVAAPHIAYELLMSMDAHARSALGEVARSFARAVVPAAGPRITRLGSVAFISTGVQTDRVLDALHGSGPDPPPERVKLPPVGPAEAARSLQATRSLLAGLDRMTLPTKQRCSRRFREAVFSYSVLRARALRWFMSKDCPSFLVIATQHGAATRAVLSAALAVESVGTAYVPHAPTARNVFYRDLPVHWALLRGESEVAVYRMFGADPSRLLSCGDPTGAVISELGVPRDTTASGPVIFAASTENERLLANEIQLICAAGLPRVEVCPHPRMRGRRDLMRLFPSTWEISPYGTTIERLVRGPVSAVIQRQSGVALDALSLGIPVINLSAPGEENNYYFLDSPLIPAVSSSNELAARIDEPNTDVVEDAMLDLARSWIRFTGRPAISEINARIQELSRGSIPSALLLDGWGPDSRSVSPPESGPGTDPSGFM